MTRREEIEQQAKSYTLDVFDKLDDFSDVTQAYIDGAEWMQETMIEKARQWFNLHFRQVCTPREIKHDFESKEKMWKSFIQFMEE